MGMFFIIAVIIILLAIFFFNGTLFKMKNTDKEKAEDVIKNRYAKGEITKEEFEEMMDKLKKYSKEDDN